MLKVISFKLCPFVQRVIAMLEAKQLPYEVEYISLKDKPQGFLRLSPHGQVPVLVTKAGQALFESEAIAEYLEQIAPSKEPPSAEQRALERAWGYLGANSYLPQCHAMRSPDASSWQERLAGLDKAFAAMAAALPPQGFFSGAEPGWLEWAWLPLLHRAAMIKHCTGFDFLASYPPLQRWQQALLATGLAQASVAKDFSQAFCDFYLSEHTYLGQQKLAACTGAADACGSTGC